MLVPNDPLMDNDGDSVSEQSAAEEISATSVSHTASFEASPFCYDLVTSHRALSDDHKYQILTMKPTPLKLIVKKDNERTQLK